MNNTNTTFTVPPPFGALPPNPICNCPVHHPCVLWEYPQKMAVLAVGSSMFGVFASIGLIYFLSKYNQIFPRMRRITGFQLMNSIPEESV